MQQQRDSTEYATRASQKLWDRFGEMFGARFYEQFGSSPSESWKEAVRELRPDQVKEALRKIRNGGGVHPPGLPEFIALALKSPVQREKPEEAMKLDDFARFGNLRLLELQLSQGPASDDSLEQLVAWKESMVRDFRETYHGDRNKVTNDEWQQWTEIFMDGLRKLHQKRTLEEREADRQRYCSSHGLVCAPPDVRHLQKLESA